MLSTMKWGQRFESNLPQVNPRLGPILISRISFCRVSCCFSMFQLFPPPTFSGTISHFINFVFKHSSCVIKTIIFPLRHLKVFGKTCLIPWPLITGIACVGIREIIDRIGKRLNHGKPTIAI
jgi:hypothetical protein